MINSPDAFFLPSFPGIGYFKVDTTIYRQFKTATVSAPYLPTAVDGAHGAQAPRVRIFNATGRLTDVAHSQRRAAAAGHPPAAVATTEMDALRTDMDVIIARLASGRCGAKAFVHQVWLPPLPARLALGQLLRAQQVAPLAGDGWPAPPPFGELQIPIGLLDLPLEQAQRPFLLNFGGAGGHLALVGAPQTGKSVFLLALIAALAVTHSPRDVQIYGIDLGGGLLRGVENLPHVATICGKQDREKTRRLIHQMRTIIEERELFDPQVQTTLWLALDLDGELPDDVEELLVTVTATTSLSIYALHVASLRVGLVASGLCPVTLPSERGKPHQYRMQEVLAEMHAGSTSALADQLAKLDRQLGAGQVLVLMTARGPATWGAWLERLVRRGVATRVVAVRHGVQGVAKDAASAAADRAALWPVPAIHLPVEFADVSRERSLVSSLEGRDTATA